MAEPLAANQADAPCPPHCCCCGPGDACCDCGETMPDYRCQWCGRLHSEAEAAGSTRCNPPFARRRHAFNGGHPADQATRDASVMNLGPSVGTGTASS